MARGVPDPITSDEVRKMLNSVAWYYRRTPALEIPEDLIQKLPKSLADVCRVYTE